MYSFGTPNFSNSLIANSKYVECSKVEKLVSSTHYSPSFNPKLRTLIILFQKLLLLIFKKIVVFNGRFVGSELLTDDFQAHSEKIIGPHVISCVKWVSIRKATESTA
jgi:hypothetical protein